MRRIYSLAAPALAALGLAACNTPSVPLPPPDLPALRISAAPTAGSVTVAGKPSLRHASVRFYIYDVSGGDGVITPAGADGAFTTAPFAGGNGDTLDIYYETGGGELSTDVCTTLQLDVGLISTRCPQ